jgi:hypothetical protein
VAAPAAYTEEALQQWMLQQLSAVAEALDFTVADLADAVDDVLLDYHDGAGSIADATDIRTLRALARVHAWQYAVNALAADYDHVADGLSVRRSQAHDQAAKALARAIQQAAELGVGPGVVRVDSISRPDPYAWQTDDELAAFV